MATRPGFLGSLLLTALAAPLPAAETRMGALLVSNRACLSTTYTGLRDGPDAFQDAGYRDPCGETRRWRRLAGAGLLLELAPDERFAFRLEPMYLAKGLTYYHRSGIDLRLDFIELPLQAKACLVSRPIQLYLLAGPTVGLRLTDPATDVYFTYYDYEAHTVYTERRDRWRRFDAGFNFGWGIEAFWRRLAFFAEIQFARGLIDIYDGANIRDETRGVQFRLGVSRRHRLGGK